MVIVVSTSSVLSNSRLRPAGVLNENGTINNQRSIERLAELAVTYASEGCDVVAPSDMMDGRVSEIKKAYRNKGLDGTVRVRFEKIDSFV